MTDIIQASFYSESRTPLPAETLRTATPMRHTPFFRRSAFVAAMLMAAMIAFSSGCVSKKVLTPPEQTTVPVADDLLSDAAQAYSGGDYARSERLTKSLLDSDTLTLKERLRVLELFALSAAANNHAHLALDALEQWRAAARLQGEDARTMQPWRQAWRAAVHHMKDSAQAQETAAAVAGDAAAPWTLRIDAALTLARLLIRDEAAQDAAVQLEGIWLQAPDNAVRAELEKRLFADLGRADAAALKQLSDTLTADNTPRFPYAVIALEQARRLAADTATWPQAWQSLAYLRAHAKLASEGLADSILAPLEHRYGRPEQGIALCLPLTGPYSGIGWKVARGAGTAQWQMAQDGMNLSLRIINTDATGWEKELKQLPAGYTLVGGPLRSDIFQTAQRQGLTGNHVFFTFLASLDQGVEGTQAWRFFPAATDQTDALLQFAVSGLGIDSMGVMVPEEAFGRRMRDLFSQQAATQGVGLHHASYNPADVTSWGESVRRFLGAAGAKDALPPDTPFQAVFLPDGWKATEVLIPYFFFYQEDRLVLLGSSLWGRTLAAKNNVDVRNLGLAVFPDAWNPHLESPAARQLAEGMQEAGTGTPDFWSGLGYDFVRFGARLGLKDTADAATVNARIAEAQMMDFSMAPIRWDAGGHASQKLFLFQPSADGAVPLDKDAFASRLKRVRERHNQRLEILRQQKAGN